MTRSSLAASSSFHHADYPSFHSPGAHLLPGAFHFITMRAHTFIMVLAALLAPLMATPESKEPANTQDHPSPKEGGKTTVEPTPREAALEHLMSERESPAALDAAIDEARKNGISEQAILEARFLYQVDHHDEGALAAMLPDFLKQRENFKLTDSAIFGTKEDWLGVIEYVQAVDAIHKGDKQAFKNHITEAFWLSPNQAPFFAPHIERLRLDEAMQALKIDFSTSLTLLSPGGDPLTIEKIITGKKALVLHFWSPMSEECEASMHDFIATAESLSKHGIAVASLVSDDSSSHELTEARTRVRALGDKLQSLWLLDSKENPLGRMLRVRTLPTMVLISSDGKILFNGEPADDEFWHALKKIDENIERPDAEEKKSE